MARKASVTLETAFGTYMLGKQLGQGGAGRVVEATDQDGNPCAVKLLDPKRLGRDASKRFKNEILFGERNTHQNVIRVLDHGVAEVKEGRSPFLVMPVYSGSLQKMMATSPNEAKLKYFDQILSGVEAAHLQSIYHRDLKPDNVLYDSDNDLMVVADFGIAHFTDEELYTAAETKAGDRLANFMYAAPEQKIRGAHVDHRTDIYALGLILNELYTGEVPSGTEPRTIGEVIPDLGWLDAVVNEMIRQDPSRRPDSIARVKGMLVAHNQTFVERQRLDERNQQVVSTTNITDPLAHETPAIVDVQYDRGNLWIILNHEVNETWVKTLGNIGRDGRPVLSLGNAPISAFRFTGNRAHVSNIPEHEAQAVIDHFKSWLPRATAMYRRVLEREAREKETKIREQLQTEQRRIEQNERVRAKLTF
jgi:serine/threonine protein kinase